MISIASGLFTGMVLQRTPQNVSRATIQGTSCVDGDIIVTVKLNEVPLRQLSGIALGKAVNGSFSLDLCGIPVGGPYTIELGISNQPSNRSITCSNVYVGDIWVLAGQSNMEGFGYISGKLPAIETVRAFSMSDIWEKAEDPIHTTDTAQDSIHRTLINSFNAVKWMPDHLGCGPGVAFGQELFAATGIPQGLIPCAHGGTKMTQWDPALITKEGESLFGATMRRIRKNGGSIAGVAWYQGCSDTEDATDVALYSSRMKTFVDAIRFHCNNPKMPFVMAQIAQSFSNTGTSGIFWNSIQEQQRLLPKVIPNLLTISTIDLDLDDYVHISGKDQAKVGARLAQAARALYYKNSTETPPIECASVSIRKNPFNGLADVYITFTNVSGTLRSDGKPHGFSIVEMPYLIDDLIIYKTDIEGSTIICRTFYPVGEVERMFLHYGQGTHPICTICDSSKRPLPVFGPIKIGSLPAAPHIRFFRVSTFLPSAGKLHDLSCPEISSLELRPISFKGALCSMRPEIVKQGITDLLFYFITTVRCHEPMHTTIRCGYDGPVKIWVDKKEIHFNPEGINPVSPEDAVIPYAFEKGDHEFICALGTNNGAAWGIMLSFERTDIHGNENEWNGPVVVE